ncbi:LOW QUALITY PROTEIN: hypothetical protein PHMEG_00019350 [Phytophthora megakarya]|uniref:Reverse transcriptase n=1 Tax=Phytophthora megakarya TaxID=4795 RepID=A0A225VSM0_9STRA|nr:LOW QUALITY PROTEIN: hypothetical protein PHMEG_00019350 [Phytophthora megakarya]
MRSRRIPADLLSKVYELLKRLLETGLIEYSNSEWASTIVLVTKKNGTDVRLCIDYRLVNPTTPGQLSLGFRTATPGRETTRRLGEFLGISPADSVAPASQGTEPRGDGLQD